jgi:hypothetical protein
MDPNEDAIVAERRELVLFDQLEARWAVLAC